MRGVGTMCDVHVGRLCHTDRVFTSMIGAFPSHAKTVDVDASRTVNSQCRYSIGEQSTGRHRSDVRDVGIDGWRIDDGEVAVDDVDVMNRSVAITEDERSAR